MTVNNLRKSSNDEEMITVAKTLIKTWKKFVPENDTKKPAVKEDSREREEKKSEKQSKSVASSRPSFSGDEVRSRWGQRVVRGCGGAAWRRLPLEQQVDHEGALVQIRVAAHLLQGSGGAWGDTCEGHRGGRVPRRSGRSCAAAARRGRAATARTAAAARGRWRGGGGCLWP